MNKKGKEIKESGPQIEEGHIDIANELVETLAKTNLTSYESRVLWALWRMTWGYVERNGKGQMIYKTNRKGNRQPIKKKFARITSEKWVSLTGIKKGNISRTLKRLCKRNIVIKTDNKYKTMTWGFQKHYKQWVKEGFGVQRDTKVKKEGFVIHTDNNLLSQEITPSIQRDNKIITKPLENKALPDHQENSLKKTYIKKGKKDDIYDLKKGEEREIFDYWNSLDIFEHKTFNFFVNDIRGALKNYSLEEIKNSIKNYSLILKGEEYYYSYEHTISGFLDPKNFEKFRDLEKAKKNYLRRGVNGETEAVEYERYKPEPGKKETEEERKIRYKKSAKRIGDLKRELKERKEKK